MSFVSSLLQLPVVIESLGVAVESNPTVKKVESFLPTIAIVFITKQVSFIVDGYAVTAKINGAPTGFTLSALLLAVENVIEGKTGTFTSGVVEIDISKTATATPV